MGSRCCLADVAEMLACWQKPQQCGLLYNRCSCKQCRVGIELACQHRMGLGLSAPGRCCRLGGNEHTLLYWVGWVWFEHSCMIATAIVCGVPLYLQHILLA